MTQLLPSTPPFRATSLAMTPGRKTRARFDGEEVVVQDAASGGTRSNAQIAPAAVKDKGADGRFSSSMYLWTSGCYTLRPLQMDLTLVREQELPAAYNEQFIYDPDNSTPLAIMATVEADLDAFRTWRTPGGTGIVSTPERNTNGDKFFRKRVPAGGTWNQAISVPTGVSSFEAALVAKRYASGITQPLDPIIGAPGDAPADQGYCLRWEVPGTNNDSYDVIGSFFFGQYALGIHGSGDATLWEYGQTTAGGAFTWDQVKTFRYCNPSKVSGFTHKLLVFPCVGPRGEKLLHFYGSELENNETGNNGVSASPGSLSIGFTSSSKECVYQWSPALTNKIDGSPGHATKAGPMYLLVRRDIRILFQISRLLYPATGTIVDQPWEVPTASTIRTFVCTPVATIPSGTAVTPVIKDVSTGSTSTVVKPYVTFNFTSDGFNTPRFWSYKLRRNALVTTNAPGPFTVALHGTIEMQDGGREPRRASGAINIHDVFGQYPRLKNRGFLPVSVYTDFQPPTVGGGSAPDPIKVVLFKGYAVRPHRTKRGRPNGSGRGFPNWYQFDIPLAGMWYRLTKPPLRGLINWRDFASDPASGAGSPYKVTGAIKALLDMAGFPTGQVNIPDNPIRLFPGIGTEPSDLLYDGSTSLAEMISRLAENYLGASLYFDENAGADDTDGLPVGQWTLLFAPAGDPASGFPSASPPTAVLNFVTTGPVQGGSGYKMPGALASYPANTVPCFGPEEGHIDPPEGNHLWVLTAPDVIKTGGVKISNHAYNAKSYQVPGWSAAPDPDSPHYVGTEWPVIVADPTLWGGDNLADTQKAVDFMTRRVFNYSCLAREYRPVHGPLAFLKDAVTNKWRKPRYYDPVTLDGQDGWYIRDVLINYRYDRAQMATYELERTIPL